LVKLAENPFIFTLVRESSLSHFYVNIEQGSVNTDEVDFYNLSFHQND